MIILGIDPGYESLGYAVLQTLTSSPQHPLGLKLLEAGVIKTEAALPFTQRLGIIAADLESVLQVCKNKELEEVANENFTSSSKRVDEKSDEKESSIQAGVEKLFFHKNHQTAMRVAEARGVILHVLSKHEVPICEYTPLQAKRAISGSGSANKKMVISSLSRFFVGKTVKEDNAADAVALAVCHAFALSGANKKEFI